MANITLTIPDAQLARVVDAVCVVHGWTQASGLTKPQFAKQVLRDIVASIVRTHEGTLAAEQARTAAEAKVTNEIVIL